MTDAELKAWEADGWANIQDNEFIGLIGPMWHRTIGAAQEFALVAVKKHSNLKGYVHGGLLMTFADRAMGMSARLDTAAKSVATVQTNFQFMASVRVGDRIVCSPQVLRTTKFLVFMDANIYVGDRRMVSSSGVFKREV